MEGCGKGEMFHKLGLWRMSQGMCLSCSRALTSREVWKGPHKRRTNEKEALLTARLAETVAQTAGDHGKEVPARAKVKTLEVGDGWIVCWMRAFWLDDVRFDAAILV